MLHTCAGLADRLPTTKVNRVSIVHKYVSTVEALNHSSSNCCRRPWDNKEQPCSTPKSLRRVQQANSEISGNAMGRTALMSANTQGTSTSAPISKGPMLEHVGKILDTITDLHNTTEITIMITGSHRSNLTQGLMKDTNQRYSPPVFPSTPSLNSSFPEALSKSLFADC